MSQPDGHSSISVAIAEPQPLFLQGIVATITAIGDLRLVATATDATTAIDVLTTHRPQVAIVNLEFSDRSGLDVVRSLRDLAVPTRIVILADQQPGETILQSLTAGAAGFVNRTTSGEALACAIRQVAAGRSVLPGDVGPALAVTLRRHGEADQPVLTAREREILRRIAAGETTAVIAARLELAAPTVKTYIQSLYLKLGVRDRGAAVATGIRRGLI